MIIRLIHDGSRPLGEAMNDYSSLHAVPAQDSSVVGVSATAHQDALASMMTGFHNPLTSISGEHSLAAHFTLRATLNLKIQQKILSGQFLT